MKDIDSLDCLCLPSSLYNKIEKDISNLYIQLNIGKYPINPMDIATALGYELITFSKMNSEAKKMLISKDVDGISYYNPVKEKYVIYYRPDAKKERLRFTIAHEIGHIRMGHKCESGLACRVANYYAAYLLAPTPWIAYADVVNKFFVSEQCAIICFNRYENWHNYSFIKSYEKALMALL